MTNKKPKIAVVDLETAYLEGKMWAMWDQNFSFNQLKVKEWTILSFSLKWLGQKNVIYQDTRDKKNARDDKDLVKKLRDYLDSADVIITKNGKRFDIKMFNARCAKHGIKTLPTQARHHIDIEQVVRKHFKLPSYSLEYLCYFFDTPHKKSTHSSFPGMAMWDECLAGNLKAWNEMKKYNSLDILSTEDLYYTLLPWIDNANYMHITEDTTCACGSNHIKKQGFKILKSGKYQQYQCLDCGSWYRGKTNLRPKGFKQKLLTKL